MTETLSERIKRIGQEVVEHISTELGYSQPLIYYRTEDGVEQKETGSPFWNLRFWWERPAESVGVKVTIVAQEDSSEDELRSRISEALWCWVRAIPDLEARIDPSC